MGLSDLQQKLDGFSRIALDTAPIIYFVEANPVYSLLADLIFKTISSGNVQGFTSVISLTEVLVHPLEKRLATLQQQYSQLLLRSNHFSTKMVDVTIAIKTAELRAKYKRYNIRTPDAIQIAVAIQERCQAFITNDAKLSVVKEIEIIVLKDYI